MANGQWREAKLYGIHRDSMLPSPALTNVEFLAVAFSDLPDGAAAMVTDFSGDPASAPRGAWFCQSVVVRAAT